MSYEVMFVNNDTKREYSIEVTKGQMDWMLLSLERVAMEDVAGKPTTQREAGLEYLGPRFIKSRNFIFNL